VHPSGYHEDKFNKKLLFEELAFAKILKNNRYKLPARAG